MDDATRELCETGVLQRLLERSATTARFGSAAVAFACGSVVATAAVGSSDQRRAPLGCIAKLLTATLVSRAVTGGRLALDAHVAQVLGVEHEPLQGVTVRHLLEHTHGLDDSLLAAPLRRLGLIDVDDLASRVAALPRWAAPGESYNYGNAGAWLLAAALERMQEQPFAALARELLDSACIDRACAGSAGIAPCAATGIGLTMTPAELVRFASLALGRDTCIATAPITPLPGWNPLELGICLGWKSAGAGWLGHQSAWPGSSIYLRAQPQRELALVVVARDHAAAIVALAVFGKHLAELFAWRNRLPPARDFALPCGVYAQAARVVSLQATRRAISAEAFERDERGAPRMAPVRATLVPAGGVWFARPATELLPYVEAIRRSNGDVWLWNGRHVLRHAARSARHAGDGAPAHTRR